MKILINKFLNLLGYKIAKATQLEHQMLQAQQQLFASSERLTIFDVGAFDGNTSKAYNDTFKGKCDIYSFEPYDQSFEILKHKVNSDSNIQCFNFAFGNKDKPTPFHVNKFVATNSLLASSDEGIKLWDAQILETQKKVMVEVKTIDTFLQKEQIDTIDILKLDTQGAEFLVLEGAKNAIKAGKIKLIVSELIVVPSYENQKQLDKMLKLYREYGFLLYNLYKYVDKKNRLKFMDGIFIHESHLSQLSNS